VFLSVFLFFFSFFVLSGILGGNSGKAVVVVFVCLFLLVVCSCWILVVLLLLWLLFVYVLVTKIPKRIHKNIMLKDNIEDKFTLPFGFPEQIGGRVVKHDAALS